MICAIITGSAMIEGQSIRLFEIMVVPFAQLPQGGNRGMAPNLPQIRCPSRPSTWSMR